MGYDQFTKPATRLEQLAAAGEEADIDGTIVVLRSLERLMIVPEPVLETPKEAVP